MPNITLGCDSVMWNPPLFSVRPFISSQDHAPRQSKVAVKFRLYIEGSDAYFFSVPRQPFSCLGLIGMPVGPRDIEQTLVGVACLVRSKIQARFFRL